MFQLFDHVYVLSQGYCVYQGATDQLVPFLSTVGLHCPLTYNPADYVIEATDGEEQENITKLAAATVNGKLSLFKHRPKTDSTARNGKSQLFFPCDGQGMCLRVVVNPSEFSGS